jgi:hypothetical protein
VYLVLKVVEADAQQGPEDEGAAFEELGGPGLVKSVSNSNQISGRTHTLSVAQIFPVADVCGWLM